MKASDSPIRQEVKEVEESRECTGQGAGRPAVPSALEVIRGAASSEDAFARLQGWAQSVAAGGGELFDVEQEMQKGGFEVLRLLLEEHIRSRGVGDIGSAVVVEKKRADAEDEQGDNDEQRSDRRRHRLSYRRIGGRQYESVFGRITIDRLGYSCPGHATVHPLDEELNLPARCYSYVVQKRAARLVARGPYDEALDTLETMTAAHIPKRQLEDVVSEAAKDFEAFYEQRCREMPSPNETGPILIAGLDCKGVPRRRTAEERQQTQPKHLGPGEKRTKKKMATVATVHTTTPHIRTAEEVVANLMDPESAEERGQKERERPKPEYRRLWASVKQSKDDIIQQVAEEMDRRDPKREKIAVCLTDGENALKLRAIKYLAASFPSLILILDIIHVVEYLWDAAHVFYDVGSEEARLWVRDRLQAILAGKVSRVVAGMRQSATKLGYGEEQRKAVDTACNYFLNNKDRMKYDVYLSLGLPIASGSVEGACGHLVKDRMELTGALWNVDSNSADAVLKMRSLDKSGDFHPYWDFRMKQEHDRRYVQEQYQAAA